MPCQKIWSTLKGFILWNSIKIVLNLGKMSKGGGGFGHAKNSEAFFLGNFDHFSLFKTTIINFSVQRLNTFLDANNMTFFTVLSHFAKCCDLRVKSAPRLPKIEGGANSGNARI